MARIGHSKVPRSGVYAMAPEFLILPSNAGSRRRHRWMFERLEGRTLLSGGPAVVTLAELASARMIGNEVATGVVTPGSRSIFRLEPSSDELLVATLHAPDVSFRL